MSCNSQIKVKICCIGSIEEAELAIRMGASAIGLVGKMPSGPGPISDEIIARIATSLPSHIESFLLTSETSVEGIIAHHGKTGTTTIQMVDKLKTGSYSDLRVALPKIKLVQVIHVINEASIEEALQISSQTDLILLDSGNPHLKVKQLGGTGRTHNWNLSREIVERVAVPVFLAGGLNAENVKRAIRQVEPNGIDLCSGVRTNGKLDGEKLALLFEALLNSEF